MRTLKLASSLIISCLAAPLSAQTAPATPQVLTQLYKCKQIVDDAARLTCYDAGVGRVEKAQKTGELVAIDREAAKEIKRESFGFNIPSLPKISFPSFGDDDDDKSALTVLQIKRSKKKARGDYIFYTENDQVWEQVDGLGLRRVPRGADNELHVRKAAMGSFLARVNGQGASIRVRRIQ